MAGNEKKKDQAQAEEIVIPLSKPIIAHGEVIDKLVLKDPEIGCMTGVQLVVEAFGDEEDRRVKIHVDLGDIAKIVAGMADIPPSAARKMRFRDALKCREEIANFFGDFL